MKSLNTNKGKADGHVDNKEMWRRMNTTTSVENHFNQDSVAEIKSIKKLMKEVDLGIMLIREQGHRKVRQIFQQNPGPKLIKMHDRKAKEVRISADNNATRNNMRH